jgi:hypothetical protein
MVDTVHLRDRDRIGSATGEQSDVLDRKRRSIGAIAKPHVAFSPLMGKNANINPESAQRDHLGVYESLGVHGVSGEDVGDRRHFSAFGQRGENLRPTVGNFRAQDSG